MSNQFPKVYQHTVPRFYLNNFKGPNGELYCFDKRAMEARNKGSRAVSGGDYLYDPPHNMVLYLKDEDLQCFENGFADFESKFSRAWSELRSNVGSLSTSTSKSNKRVLSRRLREVLAWFIAFQLVRTKESMEIIKKIKRVQLGPLARWRYDDELGPLYQNEVLFDRQQMQEFVKTLSDRYIWRVGVSEAPFPFYTSDTPVISYPRPASFLIRNYFNYLSAGARKIFPIDPHHILLLYDAESHPYLRKNADTTCVIRESVAKAFNTLQVTHSYIEVYSGVRNFDLANRICQEHPVVREQDVAEMSSTRTRPTEPPWAILMGGQSSKPGTVEGNDSHGY